MLASVLGPVAAVLGPIFALILAGFAAGRSGYLAPEAVRALGQYVLKLALPALIFGALTRAPLGATIHTGYVAGYGAASLAVFAFGYLRARRAGWSGAAPAMQALGMSATNSGFLGYPIALLVVGPPAAATLAMNMIVENLLVIPLALVLAELGRGGRGRPLGAVLASLAAALARNPILVAIVAGVAAAASGVALPEPVVRPIALLAGTAAPVALVVIGGTVAALPLRGLGPGVGWTVAGKLLLHPLAVLGALLALPGLDPVLVATGVLFASVPMVTIYPIIGAQFGEERPCAAALTAATLAAFVTLPLVLAGLQAAGLVILG